MYDLQTLLASVKGIGPKSLELLTKKNITKVADILFFLPLRYEDRSKIITILEAPKNENISIKATVMAVNSYYKNRKAIVTAKLQDYSGKVNAMWFNASFVKSSLKIGQEYFFNGKITDKNILAQPAFEAVKTETIHSARIVPMYSKKLGLLEGKLRRIQNEIVSNLKIDNNFFEDKFNDFDFLDLASSLKNIHFPENEISVVNSLKRLAIEEILVLIRHSEILKKKWRENNPSKNLTILSEKIPNFIPFELTASQKKCTEEILEDLSQKHAMNRLLIGDVGSGKTIVAAVAAYHTVKNNENVCMIAPTKILAEQHYQTIKKVFQDVEIKILSGSQKVKNFSEKGILYIGTHKLINKIIDIKPSVIIYDEQQRFGVKQRSISNSLSYTPHILTMTATPIPRSLLLTIFSHLNVSHIDQMPKGRKPTITWAMTESKRAEALNWITENLQQRDENNSKKLVMFICPFIDPSDEKSLENVASTTKKFEEIKGYFSKYNVAVLHGRMKKNEQEEIIKKLYNQEIDILVTTPIVEVGVDLPTASIMVIEASERFGLSSLHQLRGRVGRYGQQGYCLLFTNSKNEDTKKRLKFFSQELNGLKIAEFDLKNRGSGDIFGTKQSGFDNLQFADWTDFELIAKAQKLNKVLGDDWQGIEQLIPKTSDDLLGN